MLKKNWKIGNNVSVKGEMEGVEGSRGKERTLKEINT